MIAHIKEGTLCDRAEAMRNSFGSEGLNFALDHAWLDCPISRLIECKRPPINNARQMTYCDPGTT